MRTSIKKLILSIPFSEGFLDHFGDLIWVSTLDLVSKMTSQIPTSGKIIVLCIITFVFFWFLLDNFGLLALSP